DQSAAGLGGADDADRVGKQLVIVLSVLDDEVSAIEPLERGAARHDAVELREGRLGRPGADQLVKRREGGISIGHAGGTVAPPKSHRSTSRRYVSSMLLRSESSTPESSRRAPAR